jgi:uncharacterized protein YlxW (UPF0749 family)
MPTYGSRWVDTYQQQIEKQVELLKAENIKLRAKLRSVENMAASLQAKVDHLTDEAKRWRAES